MATTIPLAATLAPLEVGHVTSAIPNMTVANIRKGLAFLRDQWKHRTPANPVFICDHLIAGLSTEEFCMLFVLGQHMKRHAKSSLHRASAAALAPSASLAPAAVASGSDGVTISLSLLAASDVVTVSGTGRSDTRYVLTRAQV